MVTATAPIDEPILTAQPPAAPRDQRIRDLFQKVGPQTTRALVKACIEEGIFTAAEVEAAYVAHFQSIIRAALSAKDDSGMAHAGPTADRDEDGAPLWKQRTFWEFEDYALNIAEHVGQRDAEHVQAMLLAAECQRRFARTVRVGTLPKVAA